MSRTFSTNSGSDDSLKVSERWGGNPKARQMRCTVDGEWPASLAMVLRLQCVAPFGRVSNVLRIRLATSSPISLGAPGAWLVIQPLHAVLGKTIAPSPDHRGADPRLGGNFLVV